VKIPARWLHAPGEALPNDFEIAWWITAESEETEKYE
jgi:hypothetical protein